MKRFVLILIGAVVSVLLSTTTMSAQDLKAYVWKGNPELERTDIGGLSVCFPKDCEFSDELSKPDEGNFTWLTPDKRFMFVCCLFPTDESFTQEERLIGEAAEMGFEVTGEGDIANMKLGGEKYLSFSFTEKIGVGVCNLFPEMKVGACLFVIMPNATNEDSLIAEVLSSIRLSEE